MQSYDRNNEIIRSKAMESFKDLTRELSDPDVKHVMVGKLPFKGEEVIVNGLRYKVMKRDRRNRRLILKLL